MADNRLELAEIDAAVKAQRRADLRVRGSRAGTSTASGISMSGMELAEASVKYVATYVNTESGVTSSFVLGCGIGTAGGTFGTGVE